MFNLGDEVKDKITGFRGIALARLEEFHTTTQYRIHPKQLTDDGKVADSVWFEQNRLELVTTTPTGIGFRHAD